MFEVVVPLRAFGGLCILVVALALLWSCGRDWNACGLIRRHCVICMQKIKLRMVCRKKGIIRYAEEKGLEVYA